MNLPDHDDPEAGRLRRFTATLPMRTALGGVAAVWALGCLWSFHEQWNFAAAKGFILPWLLPLVIDGLAAAMAGVAYSASLDGRAALSARTATALAVAASAVSNAAWAWERSAADPGTVTLAVGIPIAANLAFEVLLSELRRRVQRRRGQPAPVAVPYPRLIRLVLAPVSTFRAWRHLVLELTDPLGPERANRPMPEGLEEPTPEAVAGGAPAPAVPERLASVTPVRGPVRRVAEGSTGFPRQLPASSQQVLPTGPTLARVRRVADLIDRGEELTGESVGELLGCSARNGRRLLRQAEMLANVTDSAHLPSEAVTR